MNNFYETLLRGPGYECVVHSALLEIQSEFD